MKITKCVLALALSIGIANAAQAKIISLGTLTDGAFNFSGNLVPRHSGFVDTITFTLASTSTITDWFFALGLKSWTVELTSGGFDQSFSSDDDDDPFSFGSDTFSSLAAGDYMFTLTGTTGRRHNGLYLNAFSVTAVPEADTWVMLIIGAALVGLRLRRKQQMLPSRSIAAG